MTTIGQLRRKGEKTEERNERAHAELIFNRQKSDLESERWGQYPNPHTPAYTIEPCPYQVSQGFAPDPS